MSVSFHRFLNRLWPFQRVLCKGPRFNLGINLKQVLGLSAVALIPVALGQPATAAERVTLTYGFAEISTSIEALRAYSERGEVDDELAPYLDFLNEQQRSQFRAALQVRQDVGPVEVSQFLYSSIGDNILNSLGDVVTTQSRRNGAKGLRGALVLAAADPQGLSLLGVLENFPTSNVRIDSRRAFQALNSFTGLIQDTRRAIIAIEQQASPELAPSAPTVPDLAIPGSYEVTVETLSFTDTSRTVRPDSATPRTLNVDLYLPVSDEPVPLVIASHGLAGDRGGFEVIGNHLANHGFAVAALDHPGSDRQQFLALLGGRRDEIAEPTEFSERPRDVSFLIDQLEEQNQANGSLADRFDLEKIGIIGHSFGGYTALAVAGAKLDYDVLEANCASNDLIFNAANTSMLLQCTALNAPDQFTEDLHDDRIDSVMAMNPVTSSLFGPTGFSQLAVPSLLVAGSDDPIAPALLEQIRPYIWLYQSKNATEAATAEATTVSVTPTEDVVEASAEATTVENVAEATGATAESVTSDLPLGHYLALIEGGSHLYDPPELDGENVTIFNGLVSPDIELTNTYQKVLSLAFVEATVAQNPDYQNVLEGTEIIKIGQPSLPLFVISSLTESMLDPVPLAPPDSLLEDAEEPTEEPAEETPVESNMPSTETESDRL